MRDRLLDRAPFTALGLVWPFGAPPQDRGPAVGDGAGGGRRFRVAASNAFKHNRQPAAWAAAVLGLHPDVLCAVELTPRLEDALVTAGALGSLPHAVTEPRDGDGASGGAGVWSRWPLAGDGEVLDAGGYALVCAQVPELRVTVAAVHTPAPSQRRKVPRWWDAFEEVAELADRTDGPLVVAGDWNATMGHGPLRELVRGTRLRDAHVDAGRRFARTFPTRFPIALLDRVLVSEEVAVLGVAEHRVPGSDHLTVVAELAVVDRSG